MTAKMDKSLFDEFRKCGCEFLERFLPRVVVVAQTEAAISHLVVLAGARRFCLCPTGTGSSFPANYQPPRDTVFLLTTGLNQILELRPRDGVAMVQAGVLAADLRDRLKQTDLGIGEPLRSYRGTMGGAMLGLDAAGLRHAELRRRLLGVEMVDPRGQIVKFGGGMVKNVAGYDFWAFLVGTQGRFGVVTKLVLNMGKMPPLDLFTLSESRPTAEAENARWIYANLEKRLDPDGIFAR